VIEILSSLDQQQEPNVGVKKTDAPSAAPAFDSIKLKKVAQ
jgi:hypothetical protein